MVFRVVVLALCWCVYAGATQAYLEPAPVATKAPARRALPRPPAPPSVPSAPAASSDGHFVGHVLRFGKLRIRPLVQLVTQENMHGYASHGFVVINDSDAAKQVRLRLIGKNVDGYYLKEISRSAVVPAKGQVRLVLRHPRLNMLKLRIEFWLAGKKLGEFKPKNTYTMLYGRHSKKICILVGRRVADTTTRSLKRQLRMFRKYNQSTRRTVMRRFRYRRYRWRYHTRWRYTFGRYGSYGYRRPSGSAGMPPAPRLSTEVRALLRRPAKPFVDNRFSLQRATLSARLWPRQWLAYTRYDAILIKSVEWEQMSASTKIALRRYVEAGGVLSVLDPWKDPPKGWTPHSAGPWRRHEPGFGVVMSLKQPLQSPTDSELRKLWEPFLDAAHEGYLPWAFRYDPEDADRVFSVVGQLKVPVRGIFSLMLLFVLLIGPLNFWLLKRLERRLWSLWTVPTIAFVTCVLLFLYASFSEGWGGHARSLSLTYLDQGQKRASTIGWIGFYLPLTPSEGLHFASDTDLHPELTSDGRANRGLVMDWSKDQWLRKGWSLARLPLHFRFRRSERRQERLVLKYQGDGVTVLNGLGAEVVQLWLVDAKGRGFRAHDIAPGARKALTPANAEDMSANMRAVFKGPWRKQIEHLAKEPWKFLKKGRYIAELKAPIFADSVVRKQPNIRAKTMVYGVLGGKDGG